MRDAGLWRMIHDCRLMMDEFGWLREEMRVKRGDER